MCAGDISSEYGCSACLPGYFLSALECVSCRETFDRCVEWTATTCRWCTNWSSVLASGKRVGMEPAEHCTAADNSRRTECTCWHLLTDAGDACTTHSVWWAILLVVLGWLLSRSHCRRLHYSNATLAAKHRLDIARTVWIFVTDQSNVQFIPTNKRGVMASALGVVFVEGAIPVVPRQGNICVTETLVGDDSMRRSLATTTMKNARCVL